MRIPHEDKNSYDSGAESTCPCRPYRPAYQALLAQHQGRSEEHTSELQSRSDLVCRLLLEKKKKKHVNHERSNNTKNMQQRTTRADGVVLIQHLLALNAIRVERLASGGSLCADQISAVIAT